MAEARFKRVPIAAAALAAVCLVSALPFAAAAGPRGAFVASGDARPGQAASTSPARAEGAPLESSLDVRAFRLLNRGAANSVLDVVMPLVTDFRRNRVPLLFVWAALLIFGKRKARLAALMLIPLIAASDQLSSAVIKPLVGRLRPCEVLGGVRLWYGAEGWITTPVEITRSYKSSWSFPSGHAANITAAMLFLGLAYRRALPALAAVAVLVSWSRIYTGVHWPLDVAAGMALGAALGWTAWVALEWLRRRGSHDEHGTDGFLDDTGGGAPEEEPSRPV